MFERSKAGKPWLVKQYPPPIGGLNSDWSPDEIRDDQLQGLENYDIDEEGRLVSRMGVTKVNGTVVESSQEILSLFGFYDEIAATRDFLVQCNTKIYTMNLATGEKSEKGSGLTKAAFRWYTFMNKAYAANGKFYSWDGTRFSEIKDSIAFDAGTNADDLVLNDTVQKTGGGSWSFTVHSVQYAGSDPAQTGRIYYTGLSGGTPADNEDMECAARTFTATVNGSPNVGAPALKGMTENLDRIFAFGDPAKPSWLYYCDRFDPTNWPATNVVRVRDDDGGKLVDAITLAGNMILAGKTTSTFAIYGGDYWDIAKEKKTDRLGCLGRTMVEHDGAGIWLSNQGVCFYHPTAGFEIISLNKVNKEILANTKADLNNAVGAFWPKKRKYLLSIWSAATPKIYVFDFNIMGPTGEKLVPVTVYKGIAASALCTLDGSSDNGELYYGTDDSYVKKATGNDDDGGGILGKAKWKHDMFQKQIGHHAARIQKDPRDITITAQAGGAFTITLDGDFGKSQEQKTSPVYAQTGVAKFDGGSTQFDGTKRFASGERFQTNETKFSEIHGRKIAVEIQRLDTDEVKIQPPAIEYQVRRG